MCAGWEGSRPQPPLPDLCQGPGQPCTIYCSGRVLQERPHVPGSASLSMRRGWDALSPSYMLQPVGWALTGSTVPLGREGSTQDPKDKGTGMTHPGLAAAVAAAEPCQHEELLAEQPGDPMEEIGPFKRDSDK